MVDPAGLVAYVLGPGQEWRLQSQWFSWYVGLLLSLGSETESLQFTEILKFKY